MLEAFLEGIPSFLRALSFDDWLMLIRNELRYYVGCFAHCPVVLSSLCIMAFMRMFGLSCALVNPFPMRLYWIDSIVGLPLPAIVHSYPCCRSSIISYDFHLG